MIRILNDAGRLVIRVLSNACPECGADMILRQTRRYTYSDGSPRLFYGCTRWPDCKASHGAHPDGSPLGVPADAATRAARMRAHAAFDSIWRTNARLHRAQARREAYQWLRLALQIEHDAHIGEMDVAQCEQVIRVCADRPVLPRR